MNQLRISVFLVFGVASSVFAAEADTNPPTFEQARKLGRMNSAFLKAARDEAESADEIPQANLSHFRKSIGPILTKNCVGCHGPEVAEASLRVDQLNPDLLTGPDIQRWLEVYDVLANSEMPPEDETDFAFSDKDRGNVVDWLGDEMNKASRVRRDDVEHSSFRRMAKYETNYVLQDLLGLPFSFVDRLPPETVSEDGFKNSSEMLQMSPMQFATYREIGLKALRRATAIGDRPEMVVYRLSMQDKLAAALNNNKTKTFNKQDKDYLNHVRNAALLDLKSGQGVSASSTKWSPKPEAEAGETPEVSSVVAMVPGRKELKLNLSNHLPDEGVMRVRIRAGRTTMNPTEFASLRLIFSAHTSNNANFSEVISQHDIPVTASADDPQIVHFDIPLSEITRNPFRKLLTTFPRRDEFLSIQNISNAYNKETPLHIAIDFIEITAPFYEKWPPQSHRDIFIESSNKNDEQKYCREVLTRFIERAWRRPVEPQEVDPFMALYAKYRPDFATMEEAMLEVLATVLASPEFLYVTQKKPTGQTDEANTISDVELASRLSFFLWSSIPDDELLNLAQKGKLKDPQILKAQVDRMLADERSERFAANFVQQWLGLDALDSVTHVTDSSLKEAMHQEPIAFFQEVLKQNSSVMDFIHSDYVVVNQRLGYHYGIHDAYGPHFRKVPIEPQRNRGGILTGAAIMSMNSDGKDSHPLKRGVWLLEHFLNDPPPPPPPNVPEVDLTDPKILQMTLKERIADHRNNAACNSCHAKIDPWGIAFENYDAVGAYRTRVKDKPVDATSTLFNKQELAGVEGLKRYLLADRQDQFARAIVHKMTAYALGRPLVFGDRVKIDQLTKRFREQGDGLNDLVHLIVESEIFHSK